MAYVMAYVMTYVIKKRNRKGAIEGRESYHHLPFFTE